MAEPVGALSGCDVRHAGALQQVFHLDACRCTAHIQVDGLLEEFVIRILDDVLKGAVVINQQPARF